MRRFVSLWRMTTKSCGGLRSILESQSGWVICGEATTGREAVQKTKELKPDVVILDISMPDLNRLEATRQIHRTAPRTEVLILTMHGSRRWCARF